MLSLTSVDLKRCRLVIWNPEFWLTLLQWIDLVGLQSWIIVGVVPIIFQKGQFTLGDSPHGESPSVSWVVTPNLSSLRSPDYSVLVLFGRKRSPFFAVDYKALGRVLFIPPPFCLAPGFIYCDTPIWGIVIAFVLYKSIRKWSKFLATLVYTSGPKPLSRQQGCLPTSNMTKSRLFKIISQN